VSELVGEGQDHTWDASALSSIAPNKSALDGRSGVLALTHDPKLDDLALMEALKSDAFYVGAIGSRTDNAKRRERLKLFDLNDAQLNKLHGPVGIYIGSKTPSKIAIPILAEMIAARNGVMLPVEVQVVNAKNVQITAPLASRPD
jgi:xanthine dehydrogenase accessory factor